MVVRVSEVYLSVQGEGPRAGQRTVFVRFGGCNLRCPGWPCDTQHAIDPALYRNEWIKTEPADLVEQIDKVAEKTLSTAICFTGGEPFLQHHPDLAEVMDGLMVRGYGTYECFSNGTILYPEWATRELSFIMDWKLPGSGENHLNPVRLKNLSNLKVKDAVKFVIKDRNDFEVAKELYLRYIERIPNAWRPRTYYGVVWGAMENSELIEWVLDAKLPWWINVQVHNYIWSRDQRGI